MYADDGFLARLARSAAIFLGLAPMVAGAQQQPAYSHGVVASSNVLASEVGVEILKHGGNAFDPLSPAAGVVGY